MKNKKKAQVFHFDLYGKREDKYAFLNENSVTTINWNEFDVKEPYFFFNKNVTNQGKYTEGFNVLDLFENYNSGIQTKCDELAIHFNRNELLSVIEDFKTKEIEELRKSYNKEDTSGWSYSKAKSSIVSNKYQILQTAFRPFDSRFSIYCDYSGGFIGRPREKTMKHLLSNDNIAILFPRQAINEKFGFFVTNNICDINYTGTAGQFGAGLVFPLYLYLDKLSLNDSNSRIPNFKMKIVNQIAEKLDLRFTPEKEQTEGTLAPIDILDYIYAVLHSPTYREKYKEFLKIDFPRVPYPKDAETFWQLVKLGGELRQIHLLESPIVENRITTYPKAGDNIVVKPRFESGKVRINDEQYFDNVPEIAWGFYIGGYQPAQKWLKDRKGRKLNFDDIVHYQKIIVALFETNNIMKKIDDIDFM